MAEQDYKRNPFSSPSSETDLVLLVEEEKLYLNRLELSSVSPVFKAMLEGDYKEKHSSEITLPEKRYEDVFQFLLCVYPSTVKPVTRNNLDCVLPLADEYCVESLKQRCEEFILSQFHNTDSKISNPPNDVLVHLTLLSDMYNLKRCVEACVDKLVYRHYDGSSGITKVKEFDLLSSEVKSLILDKRVRLVEERCRDILYSVRDVNPAKIKRSITDPWCPGCTIYGRAHRYERWCRRSAIEVTKAIIEKDLRLIDCFKTADN